MTPEDNELKSSNLDKLRFIYEEVSSARERRLRAIEMLNQKINWILVSTIALFGFTLQALGYLKKGSLFYAALGLMCVGLLLCLFGLFVRAYKLGPSLKSLLEKTENDVENIIKECNEKITKGLEESQLTITDLSKISRLATFCLVGAIILIVLTIIPICH
ncbi:MAG: hypothetical protein WC750_00370 [Patescibacteria group bacterium]